MQRDIAVFAQEVHIESFAFLLRCARQEQALASAESARAEGRLIWNALQGEHCTSLRRKTPHIVFAAEHHIVQHHRSAYVHVVDVANWHAVFVLGNVLAFDGDLSGAVR